MFGAKTLNLTRLIVRAQLHSQRTGADHALARRHRAVMAAASVVQGAEVWETGIRRSWLRMASCPCRYVTPAVWELLFLTAEFLIRAIWAVISAIAKFLRRQADGGVVGAHVVGKLTHQRLAVLFIRVVLAVAVTVTDPGFTDAACCRQTAGLV